MPITSIKQLLAAPIWLIWKEEEKPGKEKPLKVPKYALTGKNRAGKQGDKKDREQLVNYKTAVAKVEEWDATGVGFAMFDDLGIAVVDVDKGIVDGGMKDYANALFKKLKHTYCDISVSEKGFHAYFLGDFINGTNTKIVDGDGVEVELFSDAQFMVWTDNHIEDSADDFVALSDELKAELHAIVRPLKKKVDDKKKKDAPPFDPNNPAAIAQIADALTYLDFDDRTIWLDVSLALGHSFKQSDAGYEILVKWASQSKKYDEKETREIYYVTSKKPRDPPITVASIYKMAQDLGWEPRVAIVDKMNHELAVVLVGSKCAVMREEFDHEGRWKDMQLFRPVELHTWNANNQIFVGGRVENAFDAWLQHPRRRQYDKIVFSPGVQVVNGYYNLWHGFAVEPKKGDCSLFHMHLRDNICSGNDEWYDWCFGWLADMMQNPMERPGTCLVLQGDEGVGKGILGNFIRAILGHHAIHVTSSRHITGDFNSHLRDKLLCVCDEAFWAGDKAGEAVLKSLITDPVLMTEQKFQDAMEIENHLRIMIFSNKSWVVPASIGARRFTVLRVSDAHKQDIKYFTALNDHMMKKGGLAALLYDLLHFDLNKVDLKKVLKTEALFEQKLHSMSPVEQFLFEFLLFEHTRFGSWDEGNLRVAKKDVYELFVERSKTSGRTVRSIEVEVGMELHRLVPGLRDVYTRTGSRRIMCYDFPPLAQCRATFAEKCHSEIKWDFEEDDGKVRSELF